MKWGGDANAAGCESRRLIRTRPSGKGDIDGNGFPRTKELAFFARRPLRHQRDDDEGMKVLHRDSAKLTADVTETAAVKKRPQRPSRGVVALISPGNLKGHLRIPQIEEGVKGQGEAASIRTALAIS